MHEGAGQMLEGWLILRRKFNLFMKRDNATTLCFPTEQVRSAWISLFFCAIGADFIALGAKSLALLSRGTLSDFVARKIWEAYFISFGAVDVQLTALWPNVCARVPHFNCVAWIQKCMCSLCEIKEWNLPSPEDLCSSIFVFEIFICRCTWGIILIRGSRFLNRAETRIYDSCCRAAKLNHFSMEKHI